MFDSCSVLAGGDKPAMTSVSCCWMVLWHCRGGGRKQSPKEGYFITSAQSQKCKKKKKKKKEEKTKVHQLKNVLSSW